MQLFISFCFFLFRCVFYSVVFLVFRFFCLSFFVSCTVMFHIFQRSLIFSSQIQSSGRFPAVLCGRMCDVTAEVLILVQFPCKGLRACLDIVSIMKLFDYGDHYKSIIYFNLCFNIFNSKYIVYSHSSSRNRVFRNDFRWSYNSVHP